MTELATLRREMTLDGAVGPGDITRSLLEGAGGQSQREGVRTEQRSEERRHCSLEAGGRGREPKGVEASSPGKARKWGSPRRKQPC